MGFRTVVMLNNDAAHEWEHDPLLGRKIAQAMNHANGKQNNERAELGRYGAVVQCVHADTQSLAVLDGYSFFNEIAHKGWVKDQSPDEVTLRLIKEAADRLGYRLTRKTSV